MQWVGTINKAYGGLVKTIIDVMYIMELRRNLIYVGTLGLLSFEHIDGHGKARFYKHGKIAL